MTVVQVLMDEDEARQLDDEIRTTVIEWRDDGLRIGELLARAKSVALHISRGFSSWTAYAADVFAAANLRLNTQGEIEAVALMSQEGMSTRAIGKALGVPRSTVQRREQVARNGPPDADLGKREITGLDGKGYTPPARKPERGIANRKPLTDDARQVAGEARKLATRLAGLKSDNRFRKQHDAVCLELKDAIRELLGSIDELKGDWE
jgi:predicted DNA-binding protein (UPF0251 family)